MVFTTLFELIKSYVLFHAIMNRHMSRDTWSLQSKRDLCRFGCIFRNILSIPNKNEQWKQLLWLLFLEDGNSVPWSNELTRVYILFCYGFSQQKTIYRSQLIADTPQNVSFLGKLDITFNFRHFILSILVNALIYILGAIVRMITRKLYKIHNSIMAINVYSLIEV